MNHVFYNDRGIFLHKAGRFKEAVTAYDRALSINPNYYQAYNNRSIVLGLLGEIEKSIESGDRAIAINPNLDDAWYRRGFHLDKIGKIDEAITSYYRSLEINPNQEKVWLNLAVIFCKLINNFFSFCADEEYTAFGCHPFSVGAICCNMPHFLPFKQITGKISIGYNRPYGLTALR